MLRRVVERVPAGICLLWGRELRIRLVNQRFYDLLPDNGTAIGRTLGEQFPAVAADAVPFVEQVFRDRGVIELADHRLDFDDGVGPRYYDATLMPIDNSPGEVGGVLITFRETTEEVRRRRELEHELTEEHRIADTLQRSLMPEDLPDLPGLKLAARYLPAGERHRV
ncbi:MAG: PAS domain-containing protein, partial [Solirubrobacterales bacterium]|nr:PAS domain-containing protein [Solirubrobacterales bacterium]